MHSETAEIVVCDCQTCGRTWIITRDEPAAGDCVSCRAARFGADERHESMRLFEPAPTQIPGQLGF